MFKVSLTSIFVTTWRLKNCLWTEFSISLLSKGSCILQSLIGTRNSCHLYFWDISWRKRKNSNSTLSISYLLNKFSHLFWCRESLFLQRLRHDRINFLILSSGGKSNFYGCDLHISRQCVNIAKLLRYSIRRANSLDKIDPFFSLSVQCIR